MGKREIFQYIRENKPELEERFAVGKLGLFGSFVREEETAGSDIDLLVSFRREIDLFHFLELKNFLEDHLGKEVDLVMESALKPEIGKRILSEVEYV
ncbi:nucleotidyltransferase [Geothermobacter hydrogeniphilus]|uniref:Nucleotidyltransferase n=1 Tax=Geothermobacter hydrogeniphilus TaxID=1969733 RepID=A0A2K2H8V5_9BACT|nr:nucleotidyltransferase family protein [Geothermobacter hydrogeniphilus]PNU19707.1 nucleotidyltransferase [Geothermobacter hydrogeniphilus]